MLQKRINFLLHFAVLLFFIPYTTWFTEVRIFSSTELSIVICTTAVYKRYTQQYAFHDQVKHATYRSILFKFMDALQKTEQDYLKHW
jgi:hypothetical protein